MTYSFKDITVLIVDSQPAILDLVRGALRLLGVPVSGLNSFNEGRAALHTFKETKPDLVIADWEMIDIKGLEFIKSLRNLPTNPYVPVIFTTALTTEKRVNEARDSGITEFLAKPFTARTLCERIEIIVEKPRQFVLALDYRGPDRRRKVIDNFVGIERREPRNEFELKMADTDVFKDQKKIRAAKLLMPPNVLKQKMGSGGVDTNALVVAQNFLDSNTVNFKPVGLALVDALNEGIQNSKKGEIKSDIAIELMLYPAAQLKAQGGMFHYHLITRVADILVNFLETIGNLDNEVFEIVEAHKIALLYILSNNITGHGSASDKALQGTLLDACKRYYKTRNL